MTSVALLFEQPEMTSKMASGLKKIHSSPVWQYNTQSIDSKKVVCNTCDMELTFVGGTSVMLNHLWVKHPLVATSVLPLQLSRSLKQQKLFQATSTHFTPQKSKRLTELITVDLWPISVVEQQGFNQFISFLVLDSYVPHT